jgi:hypothetical protein
MQGQNLLKLFHGTQAIQGPDPVPDPRGLFRLASKMQIVYSSGAQFSYCGAVPGDDHKELAGGEEDGVVLRQKTTARGAKCSALMLNPIEVQKIFICLPSILRPL